MLTWIAAITGPAAGPDFRHADSILFAGKPALRIEGRANTYQFSNQSRPALDVLPDGRFVLAWESRRQKQGLSGVYARTFDAHGLPTSGEQRTTVDGGSPQMSPAVAIGADGRSRVVYQARHRDGRNTPAYLGDVRLESGKGLQFDPLIARGPNGQFAAVWIGEVAHLQNRLFAQRFDTAGKPLGKAIRISGIDQIESTPTLASYEAGFCVAWQRSGRDGKPAGLQARSFDWSGRPLTETKVVGSAAAIEPSIDVAGNGYVLGWIEPNSAGSYVAGAQRLTQALDRRGNTVRLAPQSGDQVGLAVAGKRDGAFAVAWNHRTDEDSDLYVQAFSANAKPEGDAVRATRLAKGHQGMAESTGVRKLAYSDRGLLIAWQGDSGLGDSSAANFTLIQPDADAGMASVINAHASKIQPLARGGAPKLKFERMITIQADPHEPPISNFKLIANPWDVQIPMANGGFNAYSQTSFTPPDCHIAAGPEQLVVVVNDGIAFYNKDGTNTYMNNMRQTNGFWGNLAASDNFIYDPECFFDPLSGRFFVLACQGAGSTNNSAALVGVSDDSNPNGVWYLYKFDTTGLAGDFFDSQNFGTDPNVLYVTGDGFGITANYPVYCIEKAPLLNGQNPGIIRSTTLPTSTQSAGIPSVQDSGSRYYLVEHKESGSNTAIDVIALANPLSSPTFSRFTLTVPTYAPPGDPPQSGSASRVNTFDGRFWSVKFRNGHIWATHHINSRTVARWYEIDPRGWPTSGNNPVLVQSGNVDLGSTIYTFFSALAVDDANNMGIVYGRGSASEFYSAAHSSRQQNDAAGTTTGHTIDKVATAAYTQGRWGDYHDVEPDPSFPCLMWGFAEWAEGQSWRAWVQPFYASNELWAPAINVVKGTLLGGNFKDTIFDDSAAMSFRSTPRLNANDSFITVACNTRTRFPNRVSSILRFVYRVTGAGFILRTQAFNWSTNQFDVVDQRAASGSEQTVSVNFPNPANYIGTDGRVMTRLSLLASGPVGSSSVDLILDRWAWIEN